jgi:hypothetical protein
MLKEFYPGGKSMLSEEFIETFCKSLEIKTRQLGNYEKLLQNKASGDLVRTVILEEGDKLKTLNKVFSEIRKDLNTQKNPQMIGLKVKLDRAMSELEKARQGLEKQLDKQI